ncbi:hypothetical protein NPIL_510241 [Nephila pilipes]|uniref:Uncharacterized protein n=1 Tax=Nephila pilipes TaxID=299642 RepID=A0A8X6QH49_NEPPI|nr:hypothetical protein NPIL_510241 [Nephila pilipes]
MRSIVSDKIEKKSNAEKRKVEKLKTSAGLDSNRCRNPTCNERKRDLSRGIVPPGDFDLFRPTGMTD